MATHRESRAIARPAEEIFDIVADVERYPEFVPLIREARIFNRVEDTYETEQSLALGLLTHRFRTRTELVRPHGITVVSDDQAFCRFDIRWQFAPLGEDSCHVDFTLDCESRSFLLLPVTPIADPIPIPEHQNVGSQISKAARASRQILAFHLAVVYFWNKFVLAQL